MAESRFQDVEAYIEAADVLAQPHMRALQTLILESVPDVEEKIWYNVPFYNYQGELVGFSAYKKHVSIGFGPKVMTEEIQSELKKLGYRFGKGTISIGFDQEIPTKIVKKLISEKIKVNVLKTNEPL